MTAQKAYEIIRRQYPTHRVRGCLDFGKFFAFNMVPMSVGPNERYFSGTTVDAVDKKTGEVFKYDITSNPLAYNRAKEVDVTTIYDSIIK